MEIRVTHRHCEIQAELKEYTIEKFSKLPRYYNRIESIDVILEEVAHNQNKAIEAIVHVDASDPFICQLEDKDHHACVLAAVNKLERQLTDYKEKHRNRKHMTA